MSRDKQGVAGRKNLWGKAIKRLDGMLGKGGGGKLSNLKRRIMLEAILFAILAGVLGVISFAVSYGAQYKTDHRNQLRTESGGIMGESSTLEMNKIKAERIIPKYNMIFGKKSDAQMLIDRQWAKEQLESIKSDYFLHSLKLTMSAVQDFKEPEMRNDQYAAYYCDIRLEIEGVSDAYINMFIDALRKRLKGVFRVNQVKYTRKTPVSSEIATRIVREGSAPVVQADINLVWMGFRSIAVDLKPGEQPPGTQFGDQPFMPPGG